MDKKKNGINTDFEEKLLEKHLPTLLRDIEADKKTDDLDISVVNDLANRFGLDVNILIQELGIIRANVRMHTTIQCFYAPAKIRNRCLDGAKKTAFQLAERMMEMPVDARHKIQKELTNEPELLQTVEHHFPPEWIGNDNWSVFVGEEIYDSILTSLLKFANAVQRVNAQKSSPGKGTLRNPRDVFIIITARAWENISGRKATYTTNWTNSMRGGDFISFLASAAEIIGMDPKPLPERFRRLKEKGDI